MSLPHDQILLRWNEPREYERLIKQSTSNKGSILPQLLIIGLLVAILWNFMESKNLPDFSTKESKSILGNNAFTIGAVILISLLTIFPWDEPFSLYQISIGKQGVLWGMGRKQNFIPYEKVEGWMVLDQPYRSKNIRILLLKLTNGQLITVGICSSVATEQIAEVFKAQNLIELEFA